MQTPSALTTLCACMLAMLGLGACDKKPVSPPAPTIIEPAATRSGSATGQAADPSVPPAASVLSTSNTTSAEPPLGRSNNPMSTAQESSAMPIPGQNNDHSAPLSPSKRASAP